MAKYWVSGHNRKVGAIGAFYAFQIEIEAKSKDEAMTLARADRYAEGFEHVDIRSAVEIR